MRVVNPALSSSRGLGSAGAAPSTRHLYALVQRSEQRQQQRHNIGNGRRHLQLVPHAEGGAGGAAAVPPGDDAAGPAKQPNLTILQRVKRFFVGARGGEGGLGFGFAVFFSARTLLLFETLLCSLGGICQTKTRATHTPQNQKRRRARPRAPQSAGHGRVCVVRLYLKRQLRALLFFLGCRGLLPDPAR
jgi:hypothetical protein